MSFILDALKKSESDRQRQGGPALFEVKVAPPRGALPTWAVAIAVLFVANLAVVGWLLVRRASAPDPTAQPAAAAAAAMIPSASRTPIPEAARTPAPGVPAAVPAAVPTAGATDEPAASASPPQAAAARAPVASEPPVPPTDAQGANADDFAPATEPPPSGGLGRVKRGTDEGVPLYQQLATTPNSQVPQLRLDLHAYADKAEDRWVLINMHKLHEGESLEGVRVERITPEGAVLSFQGSQFLLTQE